MTQGPPGRQRGARVARGAGKLVLTLLAVAMLAATGYGWRVYRDLDQGMTRTDVFSDGRVSGADKPAAVPLDGAIDILLVGLDSRTDAQGDPLPERLLEKLHIGHANGKMNTDSVILVHIPQDGQSAVAFSFPRDAYVRLAGGYGKGRINNAYALAYNETLARLKGSQNLSRDEIKGMAKTAARRNLINTIEQFIGRPGMIDRYAETNLGGFYHVTKALDGIKVCLRNPVEEKNSGIDLPAGIQTINAVQAVAFVRQRYEINGGGLGRVERQQAFLSGVAHKVLSAEVLLNPSRLSDLISAVQKSVVLSESWNLWKFAAQMRALSGGDIKFYTIPVKGNVRIGGASVLGVDRSHVRSFIDSLLDGRSASADTSPAGGGAADRARPTTNSSTATPDDSANSPPEADPITAGGIPCVD